MQCKCKGALSRETELGALKDSHMVLVHVNSQEQITLYTLVIWNEWQLEVSNGYLELKIKSYIIVKACSSRFAMRFDVWL